VIHIRTEAIAEVVAKALQEKNLNVIINNVGMEQAGYINIYVQEDKIIITSGGAIDLRDLEEIILEELFYYKDLDKIEVDNGDGSVIIYF
jgi:uncharacterized protein YunC (DUF1805 family)